MKRLFALLSSFALLCLSLQYSSAGSFQDIPSGHPNEVATSYLADQGIFQGQRNQSRFDPNGVINRAEWAVILLRAVDTPGSENAPQTCFPDVQFDWFAQAVCYANQQGWIKGYQSGPEAGRFIPWNQLNAAEIVVILDRVFGWITPPGQYWYSAAIDYAKSANIISRDWAFDHPVTRAEAAEILFRTLALQQFDSSSYDPFLGELLAGGSEQLSPDPDQTASSGITVTMSEFPDPQASINVPLGSLYVPMLQAVISSDEALTLQEVSINRIALGRSEDLSRARLMVNGAVVQERSILDVLDSATWSDLSINMEPNTPLFLEMNVDFEPDARPGLEYQFELLPAGLSFDADHNIQGKKIQGSRFQVSSVEASSITVSNHTTNIREPFVNSQGEIVGRFTISTIHDVLIRRVRLENDGRLSNNRYKNITLSAGNTVLDTLEAVQGKKFDFTVSDYLLEEGRSRTFTIRADIDGGKRADSVRFYLDEPEDIYAYDVEFNFGAKVINQFGNDVAFCAGVQSTTCNEEGLRQRCSKFDKEAQVKGCDEDDE